MVFIKVVEFLHILESGRVELMFIRNRFSKFLYSSLRPMLGYNSQIEYLCFKILWGLGITVTVAYVSSTTL